MCLFVDSKLGRNEPCGRFTVCGAHHWRFPNEKKNVNFNAYMYLIKVFRHHRVTEMRMGTLFNMPSDKSFPNKGFGYHDEDTNERPDCNARARKAHYSPGPFWYRSSAAVSKGVLGVYWKSPFKSTEWLLLNTITPFP